MKLTIELKARSGKYQELFQTLQALLPTMRREKGFLDCRICQDMEDEEIFVLSFQCGMQANLEHFLRRESGRALLGAIDLLSEKARVKKDQCRPWEGIEVLKRLQKRT
jgi:quinol monooxygenase YgiN